jgi:hypothetical protein
VLNFVHGPNIDLALGGLLVILLLATGVLSVRLARAESRLAHIRHESAETALERDGVLVELVRSHRTVAQLEQQAVDREQGLRASLAQVGRRLVDADSEMERFEAAGEAHEARMLALLAADPHAAESRFQSANRMIADALRGQRT